MGEKAEESTAKREFKVRDFRSIPEKTCWKIVVNDPFMNCEKIHPLQQRKVAEFIRAVETKDEIKRVVIFGSSVSGACHCGSDLDVYLELSRKTKLNLPAFRFVCDIWTNYLVDRRLYEEIMKKGVTVYANDIVRKGGDQL